MQASDIKFAAEELAESRAAVPEPPSAAACARTCLTVCRRICSWIASGEGKVYRGWLGSDYQAAFKAAHEMMFSAKGYTVSYDGDFVIVDANQ